MKTIVLNNWNVIYNVHTVIYDLQFKQGDRYLWNIWVSFLYQ